MHQNEPDYAISNIVFNSIEKAPAASIDWIISTPPALHSFNTPATQS
jgi:hypothetical protein